MKTNRERCCGRKENKDTSTREVRQELDSSVKQEAGALENTPSRRAGLKFARFYMQVARTYDNVLERKQRLRADHSLHRAVSETGTK